MLLFIVGVFLLVKFGLRAYTRHGEKMVLPNFVEMPMNEVLKLAKNKSLQIVVEDSLFEVGTPGGIVLDQNPLKNSEVKKGRKVYVTVSKYTPDKIKVEQIPELYGKDFERKKNELEQSFELTSEIVGYEYDQGAPDQILKVMYKGNTIISREGRKNNIEIEKGDILQFILSKNIGGAIVMPDLICKTYSEATFYVENLNLVIGEITKDGLLEDEYGAFIYDQLPDAGENILTGDTIQIFLSSTKPFNCED
ncbi:PASTA domain-containing protein [Membranihabitans maritimus]|uniref:PASTA domain-containing protein n=1 Tax=Membranihabitans maritimus TaxID=2904244 RepID=UPI001F47E8B8|nr:PASTA domain-containing protein [Membranihabitans maritimus]